MQEQKTIEYKKCLAEIVKKIVQNIRMPTKQETLTFQQDYYNFQERLVLKGLIFPKSSSSENTKLTKINKISKFPLYEHLDPNFFKTQLNIKVLQDSIPPLNFSEIKITQFNITIINKKNEELIRYFSNQKKQINFGQNPNKKKNTIEIPFTKKASSQNHFKIKFQQIFENNNQFLIQKILLSKYKFLKYYPKIFQKIFDFTGRKIQENIPLFIKDCGSQNGTFIEVDSPQLLQERFIYDLENNKILFLKEINSLKSQKDFILNLDKTLPKKIFLNNKEIFITELSQHLLNMIFTAWNFKYNKNGKIQFLILIQTDQKIFSIFSDNQFKIYIQNGKPFLKNLNNSNIFKSISPKSLNTNRFEKNTITIYQKKTKILLPDILLEITKINY